MITDLRLDCHVKQPIHESTLNDRKKEELPHEGALAHHVVPDVDISL
jgi:hypothetical protein